MKAEITKEGYIKVTAETPTEAFAMNHLIPIGKETPCPACHYIKTPMLFDCSTLNPIIDKD